MPANAQALIGESLNAAAMSLFSLACSKVDASDVTLSSRHLDALSALRQFFSLQSAAQTSICFPGHNPVF
jgi:hypothetical protein